MASRDVSHVAFCFTDEGYIQYWSHLEAISESMVPQGEVLTRWMKPGGAMNGLCEPHLIFDIYYNEGLSLAD